MAVARKIERFSSESLFDNLKQKKLLSKGIYFLFITIAAAASQRIVPIETDWMRCFRPGAISLISGQNPHLLPGCHYMSWSLFPLVPLAILPAWLGQALLSAIGLTTFRIAAIRFGAEKFGLLAYLFSFFLIYQVFIDPNIDWLVVLGLLLPPKTGIFFVLIKPQVGAGVAIVWTVEAWYRGRLKEVAALTAPVLGLLLLTQLIYGNYLMNFSNLFVENKSWTLSIWPYSVPLGISLMYFALKKRSVRLALLGMPWLSPYMGYYTWPVAMLGLFPKHAWLVIIISVTIWLIMIIGAGIIWL